MNDKYFEKIISKTEISIFKISVNLKRSRLWDQICPKKHE